MKTISERKWQPDQFAEQALKHLEVDFTVEVVRIADIDVKQSEHNAAREMLPLVFTTVEDYALAMERGDSFPRLVLLSIAGNRFVVVGGWHRFQAAALADFDSVEAYVVRSDDERVAGLLPLVLNRGHGMRQTREESIRHALYAIDKFGMRAEEAATLFGVKRPQIVDAHRAANLKSILLKKGVACNRLPVTNLLKLNVLAGNENVLAAAARLATGRLSGAEFGTFVDAVKKEKSELQQLGVVAEYERKCGDPPATQKQSRSLHSKSKAAITTMETLTKSKTRISQMGFSKQHEQEEIGSRLVALGKRLIELGKSGLPDGSKIHTRSNGRRRVAQQA